MQRAQEENGTTESKKGHNVSSGVRGPITGSEIGQIGVFGDDPLRVSASTKNPAKRPIVRRCRAKPKGFACRQVLKIPMQNVRGLGCKITGAPPRGGHRSNPKR